MTDPVHVPEHAAADATPAATTATTPLSDKMYNALKFLAQVLLPALGTLYAAVAGIWHLPFPVEVTGTVLAVDTFLGVSLHLSTNSYNQNDARFDATLSAVSEGDGVKNYNLNVDPATVEAKDSLLVKVDSTVPAAQPPGLTGS